MQEFESLIGSVTQSLKGKPLDEDLAEFLNEAFPPTGEIFQSIKKACHQAIADGWMCKYEAGGIRYGRVIKPKEELEGFSVDVVHMNDIKGPEHVHPNGEIDMVMPITPSALFDGHGEGWCVYSPNSSHFPTVTNGEALVLYLLPDGAIEFI